MSLQNVWFERAWERWNKRRALIARYKELRAKCDAYAEGHRITEWVVAAYNASPDVLSVDIVEGAHDGLPNFSPTFTMTLTLNSANLRFAGAVDDILRKVKAAVDEHRALGVTIHYEIEEGSP